LLLLIPMVLSASLPASVGYNYWHGCKQRSLGLIKTALMISACTQLIVAVTVLLARSQIVVCAGCPQQAFIDMFFNYVPFSYLMLSLAIIYPACLNLMGKHKDALLIVAIHRLGTPALVLLGFISQDKTTLLLCFIAANVVSGISVLLLLYKHDKQTTSLTPSSVSV